MEDLQIIPDGRLWIFLGCMYHLGKVLSLDKIMIEKYFGVQYIE